VDPVSLAFVDHFYFALKVGEIGCEDRRGYDRVHGAKIFRI
jgi:hypothetical protein